MSIKVSVDKALVVYGDQSILVLVLVLSDNLKSVLVNVDSKVGVEVVQLVLTDDTVIVGIDLIEDVDLGLPLVLIGHERA